MGQPLPQSTPKPYDVLVTGSSGHLGTALMLALPALGYNPIGIDILPSPDTPNTLAGSISDRAFISSIFAANKDTIQHVLHAATLHKPHVDTHSAQNFVDTNISGTLTLLECASTLPNLKSFVFISTTSAFGAALSPKEGTPAAWIDESVTASPKNIYGATKCAAEDLCFLAHKNLRVPVLVLRVSRFFPEEDDDEERRAAMAPDNLKVLELAYRRVDIADIVSACQRAMLRAGDIGWGKFIISAPTPLSNDAETLSLLNSSRSAEVLARVAPGVEDVFAGKAWKFLPRIDRVYDSTKAVRELGWEPEYTFAKTVERVGKGEEWRSALALQVGEKGYHAVSTGIYTKR